MFDKAISLLKSDQVVAVNTDTVWGLAVLTTDKALDKLYALKKRERNKPFIFLINSIEPIRPFIKVDHITQFLIDNIWPGRLSLVLPWKNINSLEYPKIIPEWVLGYKNYFPDVSHIGFRQPNYPSLNQLLDKLKEPLAVTSANFSGEKILSNKKEIFSKWGKKISFYIDHDFKTTTSKKNPSTVIKITNGELTFLRIGEDIGKIKKIIENYF